MPKKYWLFKTEAGCFSIDDLASRPKQTEPWDGVRNYQARNLLRDEIKKGDEVFFYHSSSKPTGIVGTCTVVKSGYPDHTALEPDADHFDPKATKDNSIWYMVDVKFKKKFKEIITIKELKDTPGLEKMMVNQRGARLSVQPVTKEEWQIIIKKAK